MAKAELTGTDKERARANLAYWEKREKAQAAAYQLEEDELARRVQARYNYLLTEIDARINDFYQRFAKAEGITMNLAEMAVSKMDVQAYNARAAQLVKDRDFSPKANQELRLYNATMRINRLEMLKSRIGLELVDTYQQLEDEFGEAFRTRCTEEYERQAGILGQSTNVMPQKDIERILTADFNNANWSSRLWANQGALRDRISELLTNGIIQGRSVRVMAKDLQELLIDPSASNALRLLRTEMNRVQTETQMASFRDNGYRQYMFISTEDSRTCSQCAHLNGEIFDVDDPKALKPPQHPNCRCSTAAYMDRDELERELFESKEDLAYKSIEPLHDNATKAEVVSFLKDKLGIHRARFDGMNMADIKRVNNALTNLYNRYPQLRGFIQTIKTDKSARSVAAFDAALSKGKVTTKLILNPGDFSGLETIEKLIKTNVESNHWTSKNGMEGILQHEFAHAMEMYQTFKERGVDPFGIDVNHYIDRWEAFKAYQNHEVANRELTEAFKQCKIELTEDNLEKYICNYAKKDYHDTNHESLAEAFAEAFSDNSPNEITKIIQDRVKEW